MRWAPRRSHPHFVGSAYATDESLPKTARYWMSTRSWERRIGHPSRYHSGPSIHYGLPWDLGAAHLSGTYALG
jgi:hypothetical protein